MAIIKFIGPIHPHKGSNGKYKGLGSAIDYILNKEKTRADGNEYVGSQHCFPETALHEMIETNVQYGKEPKRASDRVGYHFSISWKPEEEITPAQALSITEKFCAEYLSGHEVVYSVHLDQEHLHSHVVFNSVNAMTGYKYRYVNNDWERIVQPIVDKLCADEGLHILEDDTGIPLSDYKEERVKNKKKKREPEQETSQSHSNTKYYKETTDDFSNKNSIRFDIDQAIAEAKDLQDFRRIMEEKFGYRVKSGNSKKYGTYTAFWIEGMERYRRNYVLGKNYTDQAIEKRIALKSEPLPDYQKMGEGVTFLFPGNIYRIRILSRPKNPFLKKKYAELYRLGIVPKSAPRISYREKKKNLEKIRRLENELQILEEVDLSNPENIAEKIEEKKTEEEKVRQDISNLKKEGLFYKNMLISYRKLERMKFQVDCGERDAKDFEFEQLREICKNLPFSHEELKDWEKNYKDTMRSLRRQQKNLQSKIDILKEVKEEYEKENFVEEALSEEELKHLDEQYQQKTDEQKRKQNEKSI